MTTWSAPSSAPIVESDVPTLPGPARPGSAYRERRLARAERLRGWADKREAKAEAGFQRASDLASAIPFGQPILVGHYSEGRDRRYRDRIDATGQRALGDSRKADSMRSRADNIAAAAAAAIYSDDDDAGARLREKIAGLEAERERIKAFNVSARKGAADPSLLDDRQRADLASVTRHCPYQLGKGGAMPSYALSNLGGRISAARKRLAELER